MRNSLEDWSGPLARETLGGRPILWTRTSARSPLSPRERFRFRNGCSWRSFEPARSKLAAALVGKAPPRPPQPNDMVLYLGAATGTTASHIADLVGPRGIVYAVEKSPRAFAQLLGTATLWPNIVPLLKDVRESGSYLGWVPPVDIIYMDIPQPDQVRIATEHVTRFLRTGGRLMMVLKLASLGRERSAQEHLHQCLAELQRTLRVGEPSPLDPYYRRHAFIVAELREP